MAASRCTACAQPGKYRCKCRVWYCSVPCFKAHQCSGPAPSNSSSSCCSRGAVGTTSGRGSSAEQPDADGGDAQVSSTQLRKLAASQEVRASLKSSELQLIIRTIDASQDRPRELEKYLAANADFRKFTNDVLRAIGHESDAISVPPTAAARAAAIERALMDELQRGDPSFQQ